MAIGRIGKVYLGIACSVTGIGVIGVLMAPFVMSHGRGGDADSLPIHIVQFALVGAVLAVWCPLLVVRLIDGIGRCKRLGCGD